MSGALILVATPIGNLGDMSERAVDTLRNSDVIACEDSRHTRKLLNHFNIRDVPVLSLHQHNERERAEEVIARIDKGETVALVTDAGMPAISDPGQFVVAAVADAGLAVSVVPGASAESAAVAVSGLPTDRFCFEGFLPRKGAERTQRLNELAAETRTSVIYEAPHRITETVRDLAAACGGDRRIVLVRELTKIHEEVWRGTLDGLLGRLEADVKGECVLVLAGAEAVQIPITDEAIADALATELSSGASKKDAVASVSSGLNLPRNRVYEIALRL